MSNISNITTLNTDKDVSDDGKYVIIIMAILLSSVPLCWCLCCFISLINYYLNLYGSYADNLIDNNGIQHKFRILFDCLFGSTTSPSLTKVIIHQVPKIESNVVFVNN